jgi:hypothetical protein
VMEMVAFSAAPNDRRVRKTISFDFIVLERYYQE